MNTLDNSEQQNPKQESNVSFKHGYQFYFYDGEQTIFANASTFSGKETIYVNGNKVSEKSSYGRRSVHKFNIGEDEYELEFNMVKIIKGVLHCILIKNGVHFKTLMVAFNEISGTTSRFILKSFVIGMISGFIVVKLIEYWF